ncbi:MAG: sulfatase-like hydrolase/transferase [Oscillospiraceae bacterium]|nr:sulfatase-like hydrolase/transferase [Oscillospiraceae bacterium]
MNLLMINADQLRHDCVGYRGIRPVKTPALDRLASESQVYTRAFTPLPVCAPARQALLCGQHPDYFGAQWNYDFMPTPPLQPEWCWPRQLQQQGWNTAYLGRFHVSPTLKPADFGFGDWVSWAGHKELLKEKYPDVQYTGGWMGCENPVDVEDSGTHWMAGQAAAMIEKYAAEDKPWYIWVDYEEPHLPCRPSAPFSEMYDPGEIQPWDGFGDEFLHKPYSHKQQTLSWETDQLTWEDDFSHMVARYYGLVSQLDQAIGRILDALERTGQKDNTIVVFTSDHGDMCGSHQMLDKHYVLYDDICRVPLLVRYPGKEPRVCDAFVSNCLDLPYSYIEWLGMEHPEVEHGRLLPMSEDEDAAARKQIVCTSNGQQFGLYTTRMIHGDRYKYIWNLTDVDEFYDLETDPGEKVNLIAAPEHSERIAQLRRDLLAELESHRDRFVGSEWIRRQLLEGKKHLGASFA